MAQNSTRIQGKFYSPQYKECLGACQKLNVASKQAFDQHFYFGTQTAYEIRLYQARQGAEDKKQKKYFLLSLSAVGMSKGLKLLLNSSSVVLSSVRSLALATGVAQRIRRAYLLLRQKSFCSSLQHSCLIKEFFPPYFFKYKPCLFIRKKLGRTINCG